MRKFVMFGLCAMLVAAFVAPQVLAADDEAKFKFSGEVRTRFEYLENYLDFTNNSDYDTGDSFSFWPYRVRLAMEGSIADNVTVFGELQNAGNFGANPFFYNNDASLGRIDPLMTAYPLFTSLQDPAFGLGSYMNPYSSGRTVNLYQGYVQLDKLFTNNLSIRVGRQEHTLGTQLLLGDNEFYNGISYDGAHIMWHPEKYKVDGFYYKLNELYQASTDANLFGVTGNFDLGKKLGNIDGYVIVYQNLADTEFVPVPSWLQWNNMALTTIGARWGRMVQSADDMKDGAFDWNAEFAMQSGDSTYGSNYKYDFKGTIFEGWFGWNFKTGNGRSRVHVGALMASGQPEDQTSNENGQDWKGFIPLFGNTWAYNRLGDLDLFDTTGINDINIGYCFATGNDKHKVMVTLHSFQLAEDITIYDPVEDTDNKYSKLGEELDVRYTLNINKMTSFSAGLATLMPGEAFDKLWKEGSYDQEAGTSTVTSADAVNRLYAQLRVRF